MMKKTVFAGLVFGFFMIYTTGISFSTSLASRTDLDSLLGSNQILEDFESFSVSYGGQISDAVPLDSSSTFAGQGPGLVQDGAIYQSGGGAGSLFVNGDNYFGLNSQTLGDAAEWTGRELEILYTTAVNAFGFDMQNYDGYGMMGMVSVYDTLDNLLTTSLVDGGFFGWENTSGAGIGRVLVEAFEGAYIMIDNHGYGHTDAPEVPEPATMLLFGAGMAGLAGSRIRRKRK